MGYRYSWSSRVHKVQKLCNITRLTEVLTEFGLTQCEIQIDEAVLHFFFYIICLITRKNFREDGRQTISNRTERSQILSPSPTSGAQ